MNLINIIFIFIILTNLVDQEIQLDQDRLKYRGYMYNMSLIINDFLPGRPLSPLPPLIPSRPAGKKKTTINLIIFQ